jgi:hypothetical protein
MEEVSMMSDTTTVYGKTLENAGYVTRKMILAKMEGENGREKRGKSRKSPGNSPKCIGAGHTYRNRCGHYRAGH